MDSVYLDRAQCRKFGVPYYEPATLVVRADVLLASKDGDGYDNEHFDILGPLRAKSIRLTRNEGDQLGPGWFRIVK